MNIQSDLPRSIAAAIEAPTLTPARRRLQDRRPSLTTTFTWAVQPVQITLGISPKTGNISEFFADASQRFGSDIQSTTRDRAVVISLALQAGLTLGTLRHSVADAVNWDGSSTPASLVGAMLDATIPVEAELQRAT